MRKMLAVTLIILWASIKLPAQNAKIDSLILSLKTAKDTSRINALNNLAKAYQFIDNKRLLSYSIQARDLSIKSGYRDGLAKALCNIGVYYSAIERNEKSLYFFKQSLKTAGPRDYYLKTILNHNLALHEKDRPIKLTYLKRAISSAKMINFQRMGFLYYSLGNFYYNESNYSEGFSCYMKGLKEAEKVKDSISISVNLDGIATILDTQEDNERSFSFCLQGLKIAEQMQIKNVIASIKNNLASYYRKKGVLDTALILSSQSLELARQINYKKCITDNLNLHGHIYELQNKYERAIYYYNLALKSRNMREEDTDFASILFRLGTVYNLMQKNDKAIPYLKKAAKLARSFNSRELLSKIYFELSKSYKKISDFENAYASYELYHLINDSIYNLESNKQIASINAKYEIEKKEQSIKLLKKDNHIKDLKIAQSKTQFILIIGLCFFILIITFLIYNRYKIKGKANKLLEKAYAEILANVKEKELLLQEIHHRAKNNLQLISSLLKWQGENMENEEILKIIGDGRSRIKSMALIHEALYQSDNLVILDINQYLNSLTVYLNNIYNKNKAITLEKTIEPVSLDIEIAIPIGLIVTELVTNCFKYAFPCTDKGRIEIFFIETSPNNYMLTIRDNGRGFPETLFVADGGKTMGIQLVRLLVKQIKGTMEIYNESGANFVISFSDVKYKTQSLKSYGQYENTNS